MQHLQIIVLSIGACDSLFSFVLFQNLLEIKAALVVHKEVAALTHTLVT